MISLPIDFKKNKTQVLIFTVLAASISFIIYFKCCLNPQIGRVTDVLSKSSKVTHDLKSAAADSSKISEYRANIEAYKAKIERHEKMLPAEQEIPSLLETLSNMAKNSNIKILAITPVSPSSLKEKDIKASQIYQEIPILISAKSGYHELGQFLSDLENSDRFMKVVDIEIKANKSSPRKHDVELLVTTYILLGENDEKT